MSKQTKYCKRCDTVKPIEQFYHHQSNKDGRAYYCVTCSRERSKIDRYKHRNNPKRIYSQLYHRSQTKGKTHGWNWKPLTITLEEFTEWYVNEPQQCCYCDMPEHMLKPYGERYGGRYNRFTIECIDNGVGYAVDNLALACDKCNIIKGRTFTFKQMRGIGQAYMKPTWQKLEE